MPIDADELDDAPDPLLDMEEGSQPYRVLAFLARNEGTAFTQSEIADRTGIDRGGVGVALSRLEDRGLVRHEGRYWAIGEDDRIASYAAQVRASSASTGDDYYDEG